MMRMERGKAQVEGGTVWAIQVKDSNKCRATGCRKWRAFRQALRDVGRLTSLGDAVRPFLISNAPVECAVGRKRWCASTFVVGARQRCGPFHHVGTASDAQ